MLFAPDKVNQKLGSERDTEPQSLAGQAIDAAGLANHAFGPSVFAGDLPGMGEGDTEKRGGDQNSGPLFQNQPEVSGGALKGKEDRSENDQTGKAPPKIEPLVALHPLNPFTAEGGRQAH